VDIVGTVGLEKLNKQNRERDEQAGPYNKTRHVIGSGLPDERVEHITDCPERGYSKHDEGANKGEVFILQGNNDSKTDKSPIKAQMMMPIILVGVESL
jgi:hypothetical protein